MCSCGMPFNKGRNILKNIILHFSKLTWNKTFPSWEKKYLLLQQQKANTFDKIIGLLAKDNVFILKLDKVSNKWMNPINFWQTKWIWAKNISVREFNLRIRKLGIVHLAGRVCHKSWVNSTKGQKQQNLGDFSDKSQHFLGVLWQGRTVFAAMAATGCGLWIYCGFRNWGLIRCKR